MLVMVLVCLGGSHGQQGSWTELAEENCSNATFFSGGMVHLLECGPGGNHQHENVSAACGLCPDGWERTSTGDSECKRCPAGKTSSSLRGSPPECTSCASGKYRPAGAPDCEICEKSQTPNKNQTACVCRRGYFDSALYPNIAWDPVNHYPPEQNWMGPPACIECESVICPGEIHDTEKGTVAHATTCVQCPGAAAGREAFMWPRKNFWIPVPNDLVIDPLVPHDSKEEHRYFVVPFTLAAIEQCHPPELCGGYDGSNGTELTVWEQTNPDCATDPTKCCRGSQDSEQKHWRMCSGCKDNYVANPMTRRCELCESPGYLRIFFHMLLITANSAFFDFKARQVNVEEDGGGLGILIFFILQLAEYTRDTLGPVADVVKTAFELEPSGDAKSCVFGMAPHYHFFFRVLVVPLFQYLIVVAIGHYIDQWISTLQAEQQGSRDSSPAKDDEKISSILQKIESFLMKRYDSSQLRYLRPLDERSAEADAETPRVATMRTWWQAAAKALTKKQIWKQGWRGQLQVMVSVYIPVTRLCIRMLFGHPLATAHVSDDAAAEGDEPYTWLSSYDPTVLYFSPLHIIAMVVALLVLAVLTVGFPVPSPPRDLETNQVCPAF